MYPGPCWWRYSRSRAAVLVAVLALSGAPTRGAFVAHHHLAHALGAPRLRGGGRGVEKEGVTTLVSSAGMPRAAPAPAAWAGPMARQALSGLQLEYPHKVDHLWLAEDGALAAPAALHPVFYGNYDWHSAVHSHWCLCRLLRRHADSIDAPAVAAALQDSMTQAGCQAEADYFRREGAATFERPYGCVLFLRVQTLRTRAHGAYTHASRHQ